MGTRLIKPRKVVYYNQELLAVFKEMETARALAEIQRELEARMKEELCSKKRVQKHKLSRERDKRKPSPEPK